jgi:hypothetical protein
VLSRGQCEGKCDGGGDTNFPIYIQVFMAVHAVGREPVSPGEIPANSENISDIGENGLSKQSAVTVRA